MPGIYEDDDDVPLMDGLSGSGPPSAPVSILNQSGLTDTGYFPATPSWGGGSMGFGSQRLSFSSMGKSAHSQTPRGSPKFGSPPGPDSWFRRRTGGSVVSNSAAVGNDGLEASFAEEGSPGSGGGGGGGEGRVQAASTPRRKYNSETFSRSRPGSPEPSHAGREDSMDDAFTNMFDNSFSNTNVPDTPPNGSKSELAAVGAPSSPSSATTTPLNTSTVGEFDEVMGNGKGSKKKMRKKKSKATGKGGELFKSIIFGIINGIIILPVMIGFAQIIFRHKFFVPYIGSLTKLVLFSSVVHQTAFSLKSTLPFAIGQVQDAGLIFLSTMASNIVNHMLNEKTHTDEAILATVLCWLAMSTALLGCALWLTGKLQLAAMVQYLPMPVIGGYLAFIGFFCFEAGLKMMTGVDEITGLFKRATINGTHHPEIHAQNMDNLILLAPGVTLGAVLLLVLQRFRHFAVLPCMLISIPTIYYIVMFATGLSFEEARAAHGYGWLANATVEDGSNVTTADDFWDGWKDYKFAQIHWHALPRQLPTWLAMYFVVAFSSSLDVAAIQMELGKPLDFNHELKTVGISNIASGLTGGFTGSYIFSQTIFTMRAGIRTRWIGAVLSTFMAIAFTIPISILAFVPRFFFGAILSLIAYDLFLEWLWHSRHLMAPIEYVIVLATFGAIIGTGNNLELGMAIGIGISGFLFVVQYAQTKASNLMTMSSKVVRSFRERASLSSNRNSIVALELRGYIFFGSAITILKDIKKSILVERIVTASYNDGDGDGNGDDVGGNNSGDNAAAADNDDAVVVAAGGGGGGSGGGGNGGGGDGNGNGDVSQLLSTSINGLADHRGLIRMPQMLSNLMGEPASVSHRKLATKYLLIDFGSVTGLDATAARSLFATLLQLLNLYSIKLIITAANSSVDKILRMHGIITDENADMVRVFETADEGLEWCEEELLARLARRPDRNTTVLELEDSSTTSMQALKQILQANMDEDQIDALDLISKTHILEKYFKKIKLQKGDPIFDEGDAAKEMYFIAKGSLTLYHNTPPVPKPAMTWVDRSRLIPARWKPSRIGSQYLPRKVRVLRYDAGGIIGELDFTLRQPRSFSSEALENTVVYVLSRDDFSTMEKEHPQIAIGVQHRLLTSLSVSATSLLSHR